MEMKLKRNGNVIEVEGLIKTMADSKTLNEEVKNVEDNEVIIRIYDSFGLPSSVIGHLMKLKDEGKNIVLEVKEESLYDLLDNLMLTEELNVKKI